MKNTMCPYCFYYQLFKDTDDTCANCGRKVSAIYRKLTKNKSPHIISVVGLSGHGKTTLIDSLIVVLDNLAKILDKGYTQFLDDYTFREIGGKRYLQRQEITIPSGEEIGFQPIMFSLNGIGHESDEVFCIYDTPDNIVSTYDTNTLEDMQVIKNADIFWLVVSLFDLLHSPQKIRIADLVQRILNHLEKTKADVSSKKFVIVFTKADLIVEDIPDELAEYLKDDPYKNLPSISPREIRGERLLLDKYLEDAMRMSEILRDYVYYDLSGGATFENILENNGITGIYTLTATQAFPRSPEIEQQPAHHRVIDPLLSIFTDNKKIPPPEKLAYNTVNDTMLSKADIYICYRRADSATITSEIYDRLANQLGFDQVEIDVDRNSVQNVVQSASVVIVVIGKQWLQVEDSSGQRRLDDPRDSVRIEIEAALNQNVNIIPVLVDEANMPSPSDLPDSLKGLAYRNAYMLRNNAEFDTDMKGFQSAIKRAVRKRKPQPSRALKGATSSVALSRQSDETIFVSYKRLDWTEFIVPLVDKLRGEGLPFWVDQHLLEGGDDWLDEINQALRSCERMILCVSPAALQSRHVKLEYRYFFNHGKKIYPLICRETELPAELQTIQYYPFHRLDDLINVLKK